MDAVKLGFSIEEILKKGLVKECDLEYLRRWQCETGLPPLTDEQLYLFLASSDGDVEESKSVIRVYFKHRMSLKAIFNDRNVTAMNKVLNVVCSAPMPEKYKDSVLVISALSDYNYRNYEHASSLKLICMILESITNDNASPSVIFIFDCQGMGFMHLFKIKIGLVLAFTNYVQYGIPLKVKQVHFLNTRGPMNSLYQMFKHVVKEELRDKIVFHAADFDQFHKNWIPKQYLPKEFGGSLESMQYYKMMTVEKLKNMQPYFDAEERQRERPVCS